MRISREYAKKILTDPAELEKLVASSRADAVAHNQTARRYRKRCANAKKIRSRIRADVRAALRSA